MFDLLVPSCPPSLKSSTLHIHAVEMRRRTFIRQATGAISGLALLSAGLPAVGAPVLNQVLRNGRAYLNGKWQVVNLGITPAGQLTFVDVIPKDVPVMDCANQVIAPGFIDVLTDNTANPERSYTIMEKFKVTDGVTTALQMHGGSERAKYFYDHFSPLPHRVNFGVSVFVMRIRYAHNGLADRFRLVEENLERGALGVSHSLEYQPTPYDEVVRYAKLAKRYDRPFFLHLRYSSEKEELSGVEEAIRLARESGARVHINHLHSTGGTYNMAAALDKIRKANSSGLSITCCVYPYSYWATYLHSKRFDEGWRQRYGLDYKDLRLVGSGERLTAESFARYRKAMRLAAVPEGTLPLEKTVDLALREDFCMIASDGGIEYEPRANSHPRGAGCFSTAIRHGLDIGLPLEKMIGKMTTLPRNLLRPALEKRGVLAEGMQADLVVFDPDRIKGMASVENPNQYSAGIRMVMVNGKTAVDQGKLVESAGVPIKY